MPYTRPFRDLTKNDAGIAGGKGASLGEMLCSGIPVPDGFVVLADTFEAFIKEANLIQEIGAILATVDHKAVHTVDFASEKIQALIKQASMPQGIAREILSSLEVLGTDFVAVRSSATAEDGQDHAWAGQLDSYLNITKANVLEKVQHCWSSLFTPRAIFYRFEKGLHTTKISVAVVVQKMVNSEKSGIAFSVHPVTEDRNQLIIEAGLGLGEAIVSGQITPDSYVVEKEPQKIININVSEQSRGLFRKSIESGGGNEWIELGEKGREQILTEAQIIELSDLIIKIENHYGFPCDIEWAFEDGKFYIVQSRPITTLQGSKDIFFDPKKMIDSGHWEILASRPFSLFVVSAWHYCYREFVSEINKEGFNIENGIFVQEDNGVVRNYRKKTELTELRNIFAKYLNEDKGYVSDLFSKAKEINLLAEKYLLGNYNFNNSVIDSIDFACRVTIFGAVLPAFVSDAMALSGIEDLEFRKEIESLRGVTFYPKVLVNLVYPILQRKLADFGVPVSKDTLDHSLLEEFLSGDFSGLKERVERFSRGERFIYIGEGLSREIKWYKSAETYIDGMQTIDTKAIAGQIAYPGNIRGIARVCLSMDGSDITDFEKGDILISINSTPNLMHLIHKAGAIVTDEGGVTCHAAIVSRELKIPCVISTKFSTKLIKTGDLIEVDANNGVVRILESVDGSNLT